MSFDVPPWRLFGAAGLNSDRYDIDAVIPAATTAAQVNLMLQHLLADRFGLVVHKETRTLPTYEALLVKQGPDLKVPEAASAGLTPASAAAADARARVPGGGFRVPPAGLQRIWISEEHGDTLISARLTTVPELLTYVGFYLLRDIVDKTGLTNRYDFNIRFTPEGGVGFAGVLPGALERQLGIKLVEKKGPVDVVVVDHINKSPTPN